MFRVPFSVYVASDTVNEETRSRNDVHGPVTFLEIYNGANHPSENASFNISDLEKFPTYCIFFFWSRNSGFFQAQRVEINQSVSE